MVSNEIDWEKCVGLSTDGTRAMVGRLTGVVKRVKDVIPLVTAGDEAMTTVNLIKSRPLQSHLFAILCEEVGSDHRQLLLHTEVQWLSRGKVLTRLKVITFHAYSWLELSDRFCDFKWPCKLAYLANIFSYLNGLNLSLQGKTKNSNHVRQ